jgi:hypothetical protein
MCVHDLVYRPVEKSSQRGNVVPVRITATSLHQLLFMEMHGSTGAVTVVG